MANPLWGAPRIHGELLKLGIAVCQATVGRYMPWRPKVPSPTWRSFLHNHMREIAAVDMFVVVTATFRLLCTLIVLGHDRRKVIHFDVTQNPNQVWLARQMTEAFPWNTAPRFLLRDRDASYGQTFRDRVQAMGIEEVVTAPRSPWQNAYVERIIGSIRRECLKLLQVTEPAHTCFGVQGHCAFTRRSNPAPTSMHAARLTAVVMFSSTDEISSLVIFTCQPFLRPNRFLSDDRSRDES